MANRESKAPSKNEAPQIRDVTEEHDKALVPAAPSAAGAAFDAAASAVATVEEDNDSDVEATFFEAPRDIRDLAGKGYVAERCLPMPRGKAIEGIFCGPGPVRAVQGVKDPVRTWTIRKGSILLHIHTAHGLDEFFTSKGAAAPKEGDTVYIYRALNDATLPPSRIGEPPRSVSNFTCLVKPSAK